MEHHCASVVSAGSEMNLCNLVLCSRQLLGLHPYYYYYYYHSYQYYYYYSYYYLFRFLGF